MVLPLPRDPYVVPSLARTWCPLRGLSHGAYGLAPRPCVVSPKPYVVAPWPCVEAPKPLRGTFPWPLYRRGVPLVTITVFPVYVVAPGPVTLTWYLPWPLRGVLVFPMAPYMVLPWPCVVWPLCGVPCDP